MLNKAGGEIGRHKGLKIPRRKLRAGSSPPMGTMSINKGSVIYVESPFQVLQAYELAEKLNKKSLK